MARAVEQKAIRANVRYLKSKEFRTREDAIDTQASLDLIVEVNRRGLITFDSQEGGTGERAYCLGFMSASKAAVFIRAFNVATDKVAMPIFEAAEETPSSFDIPLTMSAGRVHTHMSTTVPRRYAQSERSRLGLPPTDFVMILVFDPKWERRGLWNDILAALPSSKVNVKTTRAVTRHHD